MHRGADALAFELRLLLQQVGYIEGQIDQLDQEIEQRYQSLDGYLLSIPGIGQATAPAIYAELGDIQHFTHSDQVVALVGVDPQLHQSGQSAGQAEMSKRGSAYLRQAIWHAALSAARCDPMFHAIYERQRKRGKHHLVTLSFTSCVDTHYVYNFDL